MNTPNPTVVATAKTPADRLKQLERDLYQLVANTTPAAWQELRPGFVRLFRRARRAMRDLERRQAAAPVAETPHTRRPRHRGPPVLALVCLGCQSGFIVETNPKRSRHIRGRWPCSYCNGRAFRVIPEVGQVPGSLEDLWGAINGDAELMSPEERPQFLDRMRNAEVRYKDRMGR